MQTKKFKARKINGENGVYVHIGDATFSFEGIVEEPNGKRVKCLFEVEGVEPIESNSDWLEASNAIMTVDASYCGYFDKYSVRNIKRIV